MENEIPDSGDSHKEESPEEKYDASHGEDESRRGLNEIVEEPAEMKEGWRRWQFHRWFLFLGSFRLASDKLNDKPDDE